MDFNSNKPIYLQIADLVCEEIILGNWLSDTKIPSVRDLAVQLEVNPNTVMRTYDYLQQQQIIQNKRGIGFYTSEISLVKAKEMQKLSFLSNEMPLLFKKMYLLNISFEELNAKYSEFLNLNYPKKTNENK